MKLRMPDFRKIPQIVDKVLDGFARFDYSKLIPSVKVDKYSFASPGFETTWRRPGVGVGLGLGVIDFWVGWKRTEENLHVEGCTH